MSFEAPDTRFSAVRRCESDVVLPDGRPGWGTAWTGAGGGLGTALSLRQDGQGWGHLGVWAGRGHFYCVFALGGHLGVFLVVGGARRRGRAGLITGPGPRLQAGTSPVWVVVGLRPVAVAPSSCSA